MLNPDGECVGYVDSRGRFHALPQIDAPSGFEGYDDPVQSAAVLSVSTIAASSRPLGVVDISAIASDSIPPSGQGVPVAVAAVPQTDVGDAVRAGLQAWLDRSVTNLKVGVIGLPAPASFQTKGSVYIGSDTALVGGNGSTFGNSTFITPQGAYAAISSSHMQVGGSDAIRCLIQGIAINSTNTAGSGAFPVDLYRQFFTEVRNVTVDPLVQNRDVNGLRIVDSDSVRFYDFRCTHGHGQPLAIGCGSQNITFFGGNFEDDTGATRTSSISAYSNQGNANAQWAFQKMGQVVFYGTQFENAGPIVVDMDGVSFNGNGATGTQLILGPSSHKCEISNWQSSDQQIFVLGVNNTLRAIDSLNMLFRGSYTIGQNTDMAHARNSGLGDPSNSVNLPGGVEWVVMPRLYPATSAAVTLSGAGSVPGDNQHFAVEAATVTLKNTAGTALNAVALPSRDLRTPNSGDTASTNRRDSVTLKALVMAPAGDRVVISPSQVGGTVAFDVHAWRNQIANGLLAGATGTTPPTGWQASTVNGVTFAAGTLTGFTAISGTAVSLEQVGALRPGRTYLVEALVKTGSTMQLVMGRAHLGASGRRSAYCAVKAGVDPLYPGATLLQCLYTVGSRLEDTYVGLGAPGAWSGEVAGVWAIDLDATGRLWTNGPPLSGNFEAGAEAWEVFPDQMGFARWGCVARGGPGTWVGVDPIDKREAVSPTTTYVPDPRTGVRKAITVSGNLAISAPAVTSGLALRDGDRLTLEFKATASATLTFATGAGGFAGQGSSVAATNGQFGAVSFRYDLANTKWIAQGALGWN
jgi:hypothetical protein